MEASWLWNRKAALREGQLQVGPTRMVIGLFSLLCAGIFLMGGLLPEGLLPVPLRVAATGVAQPLPYKLGCHVTHWRLAIEARARIALSVQGLFFLAVITQLGYNEAPGRVNFWVLIVGYLLSAGLAVLLSRWVCIPAPEEKEK